MPEYINKQELLQDIHDAVRFTVARIGKRQTSLEIKGANKVIDRIMSAPAADVVEVVRCKDCKFAEHLNRTCLCEKSNKYMKTTDFCSYGERRENHVQSKT